MSARTVSSRLTLGEEDGEFFEEEDEWDSYGHEASEGELLSAERCREIFFGNCVELRLPGAGRIDSGATIFHEAIALGDVFNTGAAAGYAATGAEQHLAVISTDGRLSIFRLTDKHSQSGDDSLAYTPCWSSESSAALQAQLTGTICALEIGDIGLAAAPGNSIFVSNVEGTLFVLTSAHCPAPPPPCASELLSPLRPSRTPPVVSASPLVFGGAGASSTGAAVLSPPQSPGVSSPPSVELVSPVPLRRLPSSDGGEGQDVSPAQSPAQGECGGSYQFTLQSFRIPPNVCVLKIGDVLGSGRQQLVMGTFDRTVLLYAVVDEALVEQARWSLKGQVNTMILTPGSIVAALQAGTFAVIDPHSADVTYCSSMEGTFDPAGARTQVAGPLKQDAALVAVSTWDGELRLEGSKVEWSRWADQELFSVGVLDVTGDGCDEIVGVSISGTTYILRAEDGEAVRFQFPLPQPLSTAMCGMLSLPHRQAPQPCLIYVTFQSEIFVYFDFKIDWMDLVDIYDVCLDLCPNLTEPDLHLISNQSN